MKKSILRYACLVMTWMGLVAFAACSSDDTKDPIPNDKPDNTVEEPEFPALIEANIEPGGEFTLVIAPNMAWKVEVPTAVANLFWIQDGEHVRYSMEGEKGNYELVIACANVEDFDNDAVCEVTMTMDDQKQVIARLTRKKLERKMAIYCAVVDSENDDFQRDEEYEILYGEQSVQSIDLIWPYGATGYMQWIKVDANFAWTIGGEIPQWLKVNTTSGQAGLSEGFRLDTNRTYYPEEDTTVTLLFQDQSGEESVTVAELQVTIPGSKDYLDFPIAQELIFNTAGAYMSEGAANEGGAHATLTSTYGANVYVVSYFERNGQTYLSGEEEMTSWVELTVEEWDDSEGLEGLRSRRVGVLCQPLEEEITRRALLVALPASLAKKVKSASSLVANDFVTLKEEYQPYVAAEIVQQYTGSGVEVNPHFYSKLEANNQNAYLEELTSGDVYDTYKSYGVPVYELTYIGQCNRNMVLIQEANFPYSISEEDKVWLSYERSDYSTVSMSVDNMPQVPITGAIYLYADDLKEQLLFILACTYKAE